MQEWKQVAEQLRFEENYSWTKLAAQMQCYFQELTTQQVLEKVRMYIRHCDRYQKKPLHHKTKTKLKYQFDLDHINIYNIGDAHVGAKGFQEKLFVKHICNIKNNDNAKVFVTGDLIDNATLNSKGDVFNQTMIPQKQKEKIIELLYPIKDKIISVVLGNHELRTFKQTGNDIMYDICTGLGITDKYCGVFSYVDLSIQNQKYSIYSTHNLGKGECRLIQMAKSFSNIDLLLAGHIHTPKHITATQKVSNNRQRDIELCICNAWLLDEDYSISASYAPVSLKPSCARLYSNTKKIEVIS